LQRHFPIDDILFQAKDIRDQVVRLSEIAAPDVASYYCGIDSNQQNFTKPWLQLRHCLPQWQ